MRTLGTIAFTLCTFAAQAQDMANKTISIIVGYAAGGGTDAMARTVANLYPRYLPGAPNIVVRNIPGADGVIAANYFAQQVKPDGLTLIMGSSTTADPQYYRKAQANFDPSRFEFVGGVGMGGSAMLIDREAQRNNVIYSGIDNIGLQDQAVTESMGPITDHAWEHLGAGDKMVACTRLRAVEAARQFRESGVAPPGFDDPGLFLEARGGFFTAPLTLKWPEAYRRQMESVQRPEGLSTTLTR